MEAAAHTRRGHEHVLPTEGRALTGLSISATLHCLTGCAIGEVSGMAIGTALGFSDLGTIALAVGLAFLFGYGLTSLPLLRAGLTLGAVIPIALAADTFSIATMEIVDNLIMVVIPGAMESGLGSWLFWGALSFALAVAFVIAVPVNRYLIARGKGHAVVHETGIHGGPPTWLVGLGTAVAFVFGASVLAIEAIGSEGGHGDTNQHQAATGHDDKENGMETMTAHGEHGSTADEPAGGLAVSAGGLTLALERSNLPRGEATTIGFAVVDENGDVVDDFEVEHERRMHLIVVRRDMTGFQHLHPRMDASGTWRAKVELPEAGSYRVFADFKRDGQGTTLAGDLNVDGEVRWEPLAAPADAANPGSGYEVSLETEAASSGGPSELAFTVTRAGEPVQVEPYLGAGGHLVALREGDLAFLHTHPESHADSGHDDAIRFMTEYPSAGRYRLFLQFKHGGEVHTAEFTREVGR